MNKQPPSNNISIPIKEIGMICERFGIKKDNFKLKKEDFIQIVKEYFKENIEYQLNKKTILNDIYNLLK